MSEENREGSKLIFNVGHFFYVGALILLLTADNMLVRDPMLAGMTEAWLDPLGVGFCADLVDCDEIQVRSRASMVHMQHPCYSEP
jgi:hypothetical protein